MYENRSKGEMINNETPEYLQYQLSNSSVLYETRNNARYT